MRVSSRRGDWSALSPIHSNEVQIDSSDAAITGKVSILPTGYIHDSPIDPDLIQVHGIHFAIQSCIAHERSQDILNQEHDIILIDCPAAIQVKFRRPITCANCLEQGIYVVGVNDTVAREIACSIKIHGTGRRRRGEPARRPVRPTAAAPSRSHSGARAAQTPARSDLAGAAVATRRSRPSARGTGR